jgi:hypothetical protein
MTTETQTESQRAPQARRKMIALWQHRALRAEWAKFSPELVWECSEDDARHRWSTEVLHRPVTTWATLTYGEANRLLRALKEASGSNAAWRALKLGELAAELFGGQWHAILRERLIQRFRVPSPESLVPRQFWSEAEELMSRIARRDGVEIEEVRARLAPRRKSKVESRTEKQNAPEQAGAIGAKIEI